MERLCRYKQQLCDILLVEDNPADVRLMQEAFRAANMHHRLCAISDGEEALDYIFRRGRHSTAVRPDLILLDLNLPRKSGHEVLEEIKGNASTRPIPVVILSSSCADKDVRQAYDHFANCYITKARSLDELNHVVAAIEAFWTRTAVLPFRGAA
jgi:two-component system, chemotaxis family, response regulator Rcp1